MGGGGGGGAGAGDVPPSPGSLGRLRGPFRGVGTLLGVNLGVNLLNGLVLGALGLPGFALLLMAQWVGR